jgi:hypothetical protein
MKIKNMEDRHRWSKNDDIVTCYIYLFGNEFIPSTREIGELLGMGEGSLKMRIGNIKAIDSGNGLRHVAKQTKEVFQEYKNIPKEDFLSIVRKILN